MRQRRARFSAELDEVLGRIEAAESQDDRARATESLGALLARIEASDVPLWPFADRLVGRRPDDARGREDRDAALALIAQVVAPRLAGMAPGSVRRRAAAGGGSAPEARR